jgi:hypothetical protein
MSINKINFLLINLQELNFLREPCLRQAGAKRLIYAENFYYLILD